MSTVTANKGTRATAARRKVRYGWRKRRAIAIALEVKRQHKMDLLTRIVRNEVTT